MTPKDKKKALALIDKIKRAEELQYKGLQRQMQHRYGTRAWEQGERQEVRNQAIALAAYVDLRKLIEDQ